MEAAWQILQQDQPDDFVIATGEAHTVREWLDTAFELAGLRADDHVTIDAGLLRPASTTQLVGDASRAKRVFGFDPQVKFRKLIDVMLEADLRDAAAHPPGGHR